MESVLRDVEIENSIEKFQIWQQTEVEFATHIDYRFEDRQKLAS
jgi:hypothetical protein